MQSLQGFNIFTPYRNCKWPISDFDLWENWDLLSEVRRRNSQDTFCVATYFAQLTICSESIKIRSWQKAGENLEKNRFTWQKCVSEIKDFQRLLSAKDFKKICKDFYRRVPNKSRRGKLRRKLCCRQLYEVCGLGGSDLVKFLVIKPESFWVTDPDEQASENKTKVVMGTCLWMWNWSVRETVKEKIRLMCSAIYLGTPQPYTCLLVHCPCIWMQDSPVYCIKQLSYVTSYTVFAWLRTLLYLTRRNCMWNFAHQWRT